MLVVAAVGLAIPLVRRYDAAAREGETIAAVIRGQLDEVDAQVASGQVGGDAAAALRTELKRRLLVEARARPVAVRLLSDRAGARLALIVGTLVALVAAGLYAVGGHPEASTRKQVAAEVAAATGTTPPAADAGTAGDGLATVIPQLEARAAATPDDATGWRTLATAYFAEQRFADAATAYARAVKLRPRDAALLSAQGEALAQAAGGAVTPAAAAAFAAAHDLDGTDARARYFLALARDQRGDHRGAVDDWVALLNSAPADAPWAAQLRGFVEGAARQAGIDLAGRLKALPPVLAGAANARGPDAAQVAAAGGMSEAGRAAFIKGMVDNLAAKLAANPRDADGWIRADPRAAGDRRYGRRKGGAGERPRGVRRRSGDGQVDRRRGGGARRRLAAGKGDQRRHGDRGGAQAVGPAEIGQVDDERRGADLGPRRAEQLDRGECRAAGGDQVVDDEHPRAGRHRVGVDLDAVLAVFEGVIDAEHRPGELVRLADEDQPLAEARSERRTEDEAARLDAGDQVEPGAGGRGEPVDARREAAAVEEQGGDVAEQDARVGVIGHGANERSEVVVHAAPPFTLTA